SLVRKYGKPTFLFVSQGNDLIGSGRGMPGVDLFAWVEAHQDCLVKFGGHQGAVGLTLHAADFKVFRGRLLETARQTFADPAFEAGLGDAGDIAPQVEAVLGLHELDEFWWMSLSRLGPFGTGHPWPLLQINGIKIHLIHEAPA